MKTPEVIQNLGASIKCSAQALALALVVSPVSAAEFVQNGSFETGKNIALNWNGGQGGYTSVNVSSGPSNTDLPGWFGSFTGWYDTNNAEFHSAQEGTRFINLVGVSGTNKLSQSFPVAAGVEYTVSYFEQDRAGGGLMDVTLTVDLGSVTGTTSQTINGTGAWAQYGFTFTPDSNATATLSFENGYTPSVRGDGDGVFLDSVSVTGPAGLTATTTTLALGAGTNPSTYGDSLSFNVTVAEDGGPGIPTGTVTLKDGGVGGTSIGTGILSESGTCTIPNSTLAAGPHAEIVAVYEGDTTYAGSTSAALSQTVEMATPIVTVNVGSYTYNGSAQGPNSVTTSPHSTGGVTYSYVGTGVTIYGPDTTRPSNAGTYAVTATVAADSNCNEAVSDATAFTIDKATPVITWANPSPVIVGTLLSPTQLNATSGGVFGDFLYDPADGTELATEGDIPLSVQFTPTDTDNYNIPDLKTVTIQVLPVGAATITVENHNLTYPFYGASATDLINAGQTTLTSLTLTSGTAQWDTALVNLNDGIDGAGLGASGFGPTNGAVVTAVLNTGAGGSAAGYDITSIVSLTSNSDPTDRISQKCDVEYHVVGGGETWTTLANVESTWPYPPIGGPGGDLKGEMKVTIGGMTLTGVDQLRFTFHNFPNTAVWREIDVIGTATGGGGSYATWATSNGFDPDHPEAVGNDGLTNLMIYALNLNTDGTNGSPGTLAGNLLSFTKRGEAVTNGDVSYLIEESDDLGLTDPWTEVLTYTSNDNSTISYTLPTGMPASFARLRVTQN